MKNQPRRNHYIPQFRLGYFAEGESILVYDKQLGEKRWQGIKNSAVIKNHNLADPIDIPAVFRGAMEQARQFSQDVMGGEYDELALSFLKYLDCVEEYMEKSFLPFYEKKGIDKILSDRFGFEKIFSKAEGYMAGILRKITNAGHTVTQTDLKGFMACEVLLALNNPKFREEVADNPFAQMGEAITSLLEKIQQYDFQVISCGQDILVMGDFPMLFIQNNSWSDSYIRSPYNFAKMPVEVKFILYVPITPSKIIIGCPSPGGFSRNSKKFTEFLFLLNGLSWDFANRFIYAKNNEALAIASAKSGISLPAA